MNTFLTIFLTIILVLVVVSLALSAGIFLKVSSLEKDIALVKSDREKLTSAVEKIEERFATRGRQALPGSRVAGRPRQPAIPTEVTVSIDDDPIKGDPKAPVTLIEFTDYQCPFCSRFHQTVLPSLENDYMSKGKLRYVVRDYPLSIHQNALPAAIAANCASEQGNYWELNELLFKNPDKLDTPNILTFAKDLGLNYEDFKQCIEEKRYESEVRNDMREAEEYGVSGTPAFFVGKTGEGKEMKAISISGAQPYENFKRHIDNLLSEDKN
jgi:protein-disulfide isomerase